MTAKGYTTAQKVADLLGLTLTAGQATQAAALVEPVEAWIDHRTGRAWMLASPVTDELHTLDASGLLYLLQRPVTAITSIKIRAAAPGDTDTTLVALSDYELIDAARGIVAIWHGYDGYLLKATYTHGGPAIPADLGLAATKLVALSLAPTLNGIGPGIKSYSVGSELSVTFMDGSSAGVPAEILQVVDSYKTKAFA